MVCHRVGFLMCHPESVRLNPPTPGHMESCTTPGLAVGIRSWALHQSFFVLVMLLTELLSLSQLDALEFLHENEYVHGNVTAENIFVNPADLSQVIARSSPPWSFSGLQTSSVSKLPFVLQCCCRQRITLHHI